MAIIQSPKAEQRPSGGSLPKRTALAVPKKGPYYGFLARYTLPKTRTFTTRGGKTVTQEEVGFGFVLTHDQAYRQMPHFYDAFASVKNEQGYNAETDWAAKLTNYIFALGYGKKSKAEIVDEVFDYDTFVGRPVGLYIEPNVGKDGKTYNNITDIQPVDKDAYEAMKDLIAARKFEKNERSGIVRLVSPEAEYEKEEAAPKSGAGNDDINFDGLEDETPF